MKDPFCHGLSQATQWYNILQVKVEKWVDSIIQQCRVLVKPAIEPFVDLPSSPSSPTVQQRDLS